MKRQQGGPEGILLVDKPAGWTSHDVVAKVRRLAGQRRTGHTGTLDPAATGLLVLCLGRATRLVEYMSGHAKAYTGEIALGAITDTDDAEGTVLEQRPVPPIDGATLAAVAARFTGRLSQVPPAYSAIKVGGLKAYDAARKGTPIALLPRDVTIHRLVLASVAPDRVSVEVECSAGTYVRSLARDIGEALGCGGHLASLRRLAAGSFHVRDALTLEQLATISGRGLVAEFLVPADEGVIDLDAALIERPERVPAPDTVSPRPLRMYDATGSFLGIGVLEPGGWLRPAKVFEPLAGATGALQAPSPA